MNVELPPYVEALFEIDHSASVFESEDFLADAKLIATADPAAFSETARTLRSAEGFLGTAKTRSLAAAELGAEIGDAVTRFLQYFAVNRRQRSDETPEVFRTTTRDAIMAAASERLGDASAAFASRLDVLLEPFPALDRQARAASLMQRTNRTRRVELVCDLRPLFDSSREAVEAMLPITTLRISSNATHGTFSEFSLSEAQVRSLSKQASLAETKLRTLRKFLKLHSVATLPEEES